MHYRSSRPTRLTIGALAASCAIALTTITAPVALAADVTATIADVQGSTVASPLVGSTVTVEGVVTADYRGASGYLGIVIQTPGSGGVSDATLGASDGIFLYLNNLNPAVAIGDKVTATGPVDERFGQTQLGAGSTPATVELVTPAADLAEEDMVHAMALDATVVGDAANAIAAANRASRLFLDDGYSIQISNGFHLGNQSYFSGVTVVRNGDTVQFPANLREESAPVVGGDFAVSTLNVFNYFTTLLDIVGALNAAAGAGTWDYVRTPAALNDAAITDFITNAIIFKLASVTPVGDSFTAVDETVWDIAREPIAQTFESNGELITVIANHFKSKGGLGAEPADGQGRFNIERVEQATAVKAFVDEISADPAKSDQVVLVGELGSLDHIIVSPSLADHVTDAAVWGINSPEWSDRGYKFAAAEAAPVEIAFMNPGRLRTDLVYESSGEGEADGDVTYRGAANVQPFANALVTLSLMGAQLKQVLEEQWQSVGAQRPFLKLGVSEGFTYAYDPAVAQGERVTAMYLNGVRVDAAASYKVVANSFLAAGGDNFTTLAAGANPTDSGRVDLQAMVAFFKATPVALPPFDQGRATVTVTIPAGVPSGTLALTVSVPGTGTAIVVPIEVTSTAEAIENTSAPGIRGKVEVGETVKAQPGRWSVRSAEFSCQWLRDGEPIADATDRRYRITTEDIGTALSVQVTASKDDYSDGVAESAAQSVEKISSRVSARVSDRLAWGNRSITVDAKVKVAKDGKDAKDAKDAKVGTTAGDVTVYDGSTAVATTEVNNTGTASVTLPKLSPGIHFIWVEYSGNDTVESSSSWPRPVFVF